MKRKIKAIASFILTQLDELYCVMYIYKDKPHDYLRPTNKLGIVEVSLKHRIFIPGATHVTTLLAPNLNSYIAIYKVIIYSFRFYSYV